MDNPETTLSDKPCSTNEDFKLLEHYDTFCRQHGIAYFAIDDTLIGAMVYNDLIPNSCNETREAICVGMLRSQFARFVRESGSEPQLPFVFELCLDGPDAALLTNANADGIATCMRICVFDALTNDFDLVKVQLFKVKKLKALASKAKGIARERLLRAAHRAAAAYSREPVQSVANIFGCSRKPVALSAVSELSRIQFGPTEVFVPIDPGDWIEIGDAAEEAQRRSELVQRDCLRILREIDRVCRAAGIGYFLCSGTLLGAVRNGRFIPWDDDVDVGMLRPDYDRFVQLAPELLGDEYFLQTIETDPDVPYLYAKVRLNDTEYVTKYSQYRKMHKGISADIFPFDLAPVDSEEFVEHLGKAERLAQQHKLLCGRQVPEAIPRRQARNPIEFLTHAAMKAWYRRYWRQSTLDTYADYISHVTKYSDSDASYAVSYVNRFTCIPLDALLPYREIEFEGESFLAPREPTVMLAMLYDDFMEEPPIHMRGAHSVVRWRTSTGEGSTLHSE